MLWAVGRLAAQHKIECFLSLEEQMVLAAEVRGKAAKP